MNYTPLAPPLLAGYASSHVEACVVVPARNEEEILARALDALRLQYDHKSNRLSPDRYEVILLLNNCTDASEAVALHYQQMHPTFHLYIATCTLPSDEAHVGKARRLLMDTAYHRLQRTRTHYPAILSTDADTIVAPDWIARNLAAIEEGADVVGGVINLFPEDLSVLKLLDPGTHVAYQRDRELQGLVAKLEAILDPDPADPWPRHLEHFGASLACTTSIYAHAGGLPPVRPLEDVAFIDALRKVGARIRHCPRTQVSTSARLDGRAEVGLSGQLKLWQQQSRSNDPHLVDSAQWTEHRFRLLAALRRINESRDLPSLSTYSAPWRSRIAALHADRLRTPRFLELLDCNTLIEETFDLSKHSRRFEIENVLAALAATISDLAAHNCRRDDSGVAQ
jgi:hypothetical protein